MDPKQVTVWLAVPTDVPDGDAAEILQMAVLARPAAGCLTSRPALSSFTAHRPHCAACQAWHTLGQPAQLAGPDADAWLCARLRTLATVAPVGTDTWVTAQAHVAACPTCRAGLFDGLAWPDCQGVRLRLAGCYWDRPGEPGSRLGEEDYVWFGGEALLQHLERCLPCRQWCLAGTSCHTVIRSLLRCWFWIQPMTQIVDHKWWRNVAAWPFLNPVDVAHLQLCQSCQQHLTAYLTDFGADWLFESAARFCMPYAELVQRPLSAAAIAQREQWLTTACRRALAHRAVAGRWQPEDDELDVRFPRRR